MFTSIFVVMTLTIGQAGPTPTLPEPADDGWHAAGSGKAQDPVPAKPAVPPATPETPTAPAAETPKTEDCTVGFMHRFFKAYCDEFAKKQEGIFGSGVFTHGRTYDCEGKGKNPPEDGKENGNGTSNDPPPPARRAPPDPWSSPPFPGNQYQGYPLIGVPNDDAVYPLMKAINGIPWGIGDCIKESGIKVYGWATASMNLSTNRNSNAPTSYWIVPNQFELDQVVLRFERQADTVQTDHVDWGFRSTGVYGEDYRYTTAGGWLSDQLLKHNRLNGFDPVEQYVDVYIPWVMEGMIVRVGRWVACPDIETQLSTDNYLGSHSLLFTYDTYTQTGVMLTFRPQERVLFQVGVTSGTDMAPWYYGATPTGFIGYRYVTQANNDAFYTCLNNINDAIYRKGQIDGQTAGHDNYNYIVSTWEHRFNEDVHTKTEAYFMWQRDAVMGGTPSVGTPQGFGGGGGAGKFIPGYSLDYGILNYTMFRMSERDYFTVRNEWWNDPQGERTGFRSSYSSNTIGWSHQFNNYLMLRPEIGYYHSYNGPTFDLGTRSNMLMGGFDITIRF